MSNMMLMYGAPPPPWRPKPEDFLPRVPKEPIQPADSPGDIARRVADLMKPVAGKVDPPPAGADRELEAIRLVATTLELFYSSIHALSEQLTDAERKRVLRYLTDRYGPLPQRKEP